MQNYILLLSHSSFQNNGSKIIKILRIYDKLLIFTWTTKYFYLGLELALGIILDLDLDAVETQNLRAIGIWITTPLSRF